MIRLTLNCLKGQGGGNRRGPSRATGAQFRRRANPRARGASLNVNGHKVADGLREHTMFNLGDWKFMANRAGAIQNVRVEGLGGPDDTRYPSREKPWDDSWGELDNVKSKTEQERWNHFPDRRPVGERKLIPKIVVPKDLAGIESWGMKPYIARNEKLLYQDSDNFIRQEEPFTSEQYWEKGYRKLYQDRLNKEIPVIEENPKDKISE